ncbi:MAG: hypothetical protein IRZ21_11105 [Thermoleophilaceae bacterium]|nr:hypothetical protein [Thermoleophilaceae bacterium]
MTRSGPRSRTRKIRPWLHPRLAPALVVALATLSLLAPAAARAALGVSSVSVTPAAPPAGAHVDIGISIGISGASASPDGQLDNLRIHLPPGLVGNPSATPRCPQATFEANGCPSNTVVGSTTVHALAWVLGLGPAAVDASGTIYNVEPGPGEPARLGAKVDVLPIPLLGLPGFTFHVPVGVSLRPTDYGLDATITGIPASAVGATLAVTGMDLTLEGAPSGASGTAFVTTPTTCAPATVTVEAASKAEPESYASASGSVTPSDCDGLPPFDPGTTVDLETTRSDTPSAYTIAVTVPPRGGRRSPAPVARAADDRRPAEGDDALATVRGRHVGLHGRPVR